MNHRLTLLCAAGFVALIGCDLAGMWVDDSRPPGEAFEQVHTLAYVATPVYGDVTGAARIVVDEPGKDPRILPLDPQAGFERPRWSPDGSRLLFEGGGYPGSVYVSRVDGSGLHSLTPGTCDDAAEWSPDGSKIAYSSRCGGAFAAIHVLDLETGQSIRLAESLRADLPQWSPDGRRLLFRVWPTSTSEFDLWIMNSDGSDMRPLADIVGEKNFGAWSPDGTEIVFSLGPGNDNDLYRIGADGSGLQRLTSTPSFDNEPVWSPDGRQICFVSGREKWNDRPVYRLFLMNADGSNQQRLSEITGGYPAWSPDGKRIAFSTGASIRIIDLSTRAVHIVAEEANMFYKDPSFSPVP